jgi:chromate transport protein ChrA
VSVDGPGITQPSERVAFYASIAAGLLVLIGIWRLRRSRLEAYRWFDRALLVWILVVQVYMFRQMQFAAVLGLAVDLFVWAMVRSAITIEEQRRLLGEDASESAPSPAPPGSRGPTTTEPLAT